MRNYDVVRTFGLWKHPDKHTFYRLIRLHDDTGLSPYALQWGQVDEQEGTFTPIDAHRHDAARMQHSPEQWAFDWTTGIYGARRLLDYETTLRLYERLSEAAYGLRELDMTEAERTELLSLAHAITRDLRARAGFDPRPDFPGLERMLIEWDQDTTGSDTTGYVFVETGTPGVGKSVLLPTGGGSRMDRPMGGGA